MPKEIHNDRSEFIFREEQRGDCYRLLAACFCLPQKELFVQENLIENLTRSFELVCPEAAEFSMRMKKALSRYSNEDLSVVYAKLFIGPFEVKAPPYGSVYLDEGRRVMGDTTMEVMDLYRREGLSIDNEFKEPPDHISSELEFMYYLVHREVSALKRADTDAGQQYREKQKLFLNKFLKIWIPLFCERVRGGTDNEFYRSLADCLLTFINNSQVTGKLPESLARETMAV
jgi:TorA maturation chaperone TorD